MNLINKTMDLHYSLRLRPVPDLKTLTSMMDDYLGDIVPVEKNAFLDYTCPICHLLTAQTPQRARCCRKLFCKACIDKWRKTKSHNNFTCPMCRKELEDNYFEDGNATKRIRETKVYCPTSNVEKTRDTWPPDEAEPMPMAMKCSWTGELKSVDSHLKVCEYKVVNCPNDGCGIKTERRNFEMHFKTDCVFRCGHCKRRLKFSNHYNQCSEFPVTCPNQGCTASKIKKKNLKHHTSSCLYRKVPCSACCGESIPYIQRQTHLKTSCVKRIVKCKYCNVKGGEFEFINGEHYDSICTRVPVPCPNDGCTEKVKRGFKTEHIAVCPKQRVSCKYVGICDAEMLRENEKLHYTAGEEHLTSAYTELLRLQEEHRQLLPLLEKDKTGHELKIMRLKKEHESKIMLMKETHEAEVMVLKKKGHNPRTPLLMNEKKHAEFCERHESEIIRLKAKHKREMRQVKENHESEKRWLISRLKHKPEKVYVPLIHTVEIPTTPSLEQTVIGLVIIVIVVFVLFYAYYVCECFLFNLVHDKN